MNVRLISKLALLVVAHGGPANLSPAAEGDVKSPAIHFRNGDFAAGRLLDASDPAVLSWQSAGFARPLQFDVASVHSVQFPTAAARAESAGPFCFELAGGDSLFGDLVSLDDFQAVLEVAGLGKLHVNRDALLRFYRSTPEDLLYAGPGGLQGWRATGPEKAWREAGGHLATDVPGAAIWREIKSTPLSRYDFELSWSELSNFELTVATDLVFNRSAFRIETIGDDLVLTRETAKRGDLAPLQRLRPGAGRLRLSILFDQPTGRVLLFSAAGEKLADLTVQDGENEPHRFVRLANRRGSIKLELLTVARWSGVAPPSIVAGQAAIRQTDRAIVAAEVKSFDSSSKQLVVTQDGTERRIDKRDLQDVVLSQPDDSQPGRDVLVSLVSGARLSGKLVKFQQGGVTLQSPDIDEPLLLPANDLQAVLFAGTPAPIVADAKTASTDARLELSGVSLRGKLAESGDDDESCLLFLPKNGTAASPLSADATGRLVLRETSPPPKPKTAAATERLPQGFQIVNGVRITSRRDRRRHAAVRPPPGESVLHLRSGDTFPCRVLFIDERGVGFKSSAVSAEFVPHDRIKALELRLDVLPVKIEKAKFERLLTLPRMQRDNPPEQLVRSLEGDYLRGRLVAMNDRELQIELRLETKTVDRSQVSRILWLHPDESAKANVAKPAAAASEKLPAGVRVQAVPSAGNRLTFFAQKLAGKTLSGESDLLGACHVDLEQIDLLLIGGVIEEAAGTLAFHQWKLRAAAEPLPDPEPGSGGEGLESVLVGKPAPAIELDLLDGKKFRLSDCKDKIVVLDFWASWCGPCLQTMPQVDAVAREFADRGVQLVTVNLEETPAQVKTALERLKLQMPVALDRDGRIAERYGASSIPQTVIVDRQGNVARLFVGGNSRFDEQLRQALRAILDKPAEEPK